MNNAMGNILALLFLCGLIATLHDLYRRSR